ncbi:uncharacterized protein [Littorina saxatilis]|uniref:uncharacterized protein n=1 Tax=Littorina saxatilis TaxID=31220 RepID=UPI0038B4BE9B
MGCFSSRQLLQHLVWKLLLVVAIVFKGGGGEKQSCDPAFKQGVENCMRPLKGFPVLTRDRTLLAEDWGKTDVICRWKLIHSTSLCLSSLYAVCPDTKVHRSLCGYTGLDPKLLVHYGDLVCKHKDVLKNHSACMNSSRCSLKQCLDKYDPFIPSRLSTGLWKSPRYTPYCSYHAYAEHCHEKLLFYQCGTELYYVQMDILKNMRPSPCTDQQVKHLKRRFRLSEIDVVFNGASDLTHCRSRSVTNVLIGAVIVVMLGGVDVFDIR